MRPQIYLTASTRSSPSPPPDSPGAIVTDTGLTLPSGSQVRRRGRTGAQPGLTPIRPTVDYSTTNSYLGGESTVDNDTTDGDTYAIPRYSRSRVSNSGANQVMSLASRSRAESPDSRSRSLADRRVAPSHRRESPHPPTASARSTGPVTQSPRCFYLLPDKITLGPLSIDARQAAEYALLNAALALAAWRLSIVGEQSVAFGSFHASHFRQLFYNLYSFTMHHGLHPCLRVRLVDCGFV
ncbi:hypothetical protein FS749_012687 [Ceratobasidium sp. UAMH 11750]|nr:hypothetical protein FS749_012687 [Ceratobasidium sp. UAMH 11750]